MKTKITKKFTNYILLLSILFSNLQLLSYTILASDTDKEVITGEIIQTDINSDSISYYHFTPNESNIYHIYSIGDKDTYGYVYDKNKNLLYSDNDSGDDFNFSIDIYMEKGQEYYLVVDFFLDNEIGTIQWIVEEDHKTDAVENISTYSDNQNLSISNYEDFYYTVLENDTLEITGYTGNETDIVIPDTIDGKIVTSIGDSAFYNNTTTITSIVIPNTVTAIKDYAFGECSELTNIQISENLLELGSYAFNNCYALEDVNLNSKLTSIGDYAFSNTGLVNANIPDSVTSMGEGVFYYCEKLSQVSIGKGIREIPYLTFAFNYSLNQIDIPENITKIGDFSFLYCGLNAIEIPDSVASIGISAFDGSFNLKSVIIGNGLTEISKNAFQYCPLTEIKIGPNVIKLDQKSFSNTSISELRIPNNVTEIEYATFANCTNLNNIEFPNSLNKIGAFAFDNTEWYTQQSDGVIYAGSVVYDYKGNMPEYTDLTIKYGTKGIADNAFLYQVHLTGIMLPEGLATIGNYSFFGCDNLNTVVIPSSVTEIGNKALGYYTTTENFIPWQTANPENILSVKYLKYDDFTIYGEEGSVAEEYANANGFNFIAYGWSYKNGQWYYTDLSGNNVTGWEKIDNTWYYFNSDGAMTTGWQKIDNKWYYLDSNGAMATGWKLINGKWYYLNNDMKTGWQKIDNKWYYLDSNGAMATGWKLINGKWYYLNNDMKTGWQKIDNKWYYLESNGAMATGWKLINGKWYYLNNDMKTGWQKIDNKWYYLDSNGAMATGWKLVNGKWYYLNNDMKTGWQKINNKWYYLDSNGAMATGKQNINGKTYTFDSNGVWLGY